MLTGPQFHSASIGVFVASYRKGRQTEKDIIEKRHDKATIFSHDNTQSRFLINTLSLFFGSRSTSSIYSKLESQFMYIAGAAGRQRSWHEPCEL